MLPFLAFAAHGHWIDHYRSAAGMPCCAQRDCVQVPMRLLSIQEETVTIEIPSRQATITIPRQSYHPSEDASDYWCAVSLEHPPTPENTRCIFLAAGG